MKPALLLCLLSLSACTTTLTVESEVPGVTVSDVTFTTKNRTYLAPEQLLPGQKTSEIMIFVDDEDEIERISREVFDLSTNLHLDRGATVDEVRRSLELTPC